MHATTLTLSQLQRRDLRSYKHYGTNFNISSCSTYTLPVALFLPSLSVLVNGFAAFDG
jgi:hypothetical protein